MDSDLTRAHWERVYRSRRADEVSWYEEEPRLSLELLHEAGAATNSAIIDIGGGASRLAESLLREGFEDITVLDISAPALDAAKAHLGADHARVDWIAADVTRWQPPRTYDFWHDRAAFHFLTEAEDAQAYARVLRQALKPGGAAIIGTFAPDGPERCSGLPVCRHDANSIAAILGEGVALVSERRHTHATPWSASQNFQFSTFRRLDGHS